jgi:anaerobic selenocysteine-containing dehydrogenase
MRACALLPAATGNFAKPGAGVYYLNGGSRRGINGGYLAGSRLRSGPAASFSQMDLAARLEDAARARAFLCWNINPAASSPEQRRLHAALARDRLFTVVIDLFATDTARFADIVLPAASFLEFDDLVSPYFHLALSAQAKAAEPMGEALPNQEIFRRLARAMDYTEPELYESDADIIATVLQQVGLGLDFAGLAARGTVPISGEPVIQFADLAFPTPSRHIEIASRAAESDGHPRVPLPTADARPADGRLRLLSPASPWLMNDSYGNDARISERLGPATVALHPDDAAMCGLAEGADARLENDTGSLILAVTFSDAVPRGVALTHKGRWPGREAQGVNVNVLNPGIKSDMGESTCVHGIEVRITPAT